MARLSDWMGALPDWGAMAGLAPLDPPLVRGIVFSGCASVSRGVSCKSLLARWMEFQQTSVAGVVEAKDELIKFWRSWVQGQGHKRGQMLQTGTHISWTGWRILTKFYTNVYSISQINWLRFEGQRIKVKVTIRSVVSVSYCGGRRHSYWRLWSKYQLVIFVFGQCFMLCSAFIIVYSVFINFTVLSGK